MKHLHIVYLICIMMMLSFFMTAQSFQLYDYINPDTSSFTIEQKRRLDIIATDSTITNYHFIEIDNFIGDSRFDGRLQVELPNRGIITDFTFESTDSDETYHAWFGNIVEDGNDYGKLVYIQDVISSETFGHYTYDSLHFEFIPLSGDIHVIAETYIEPDVEICYQPEDITTTANFQGEELQPEYYNKYEEPNIKKTEFHDFRGNRECDDDIIRVLVMYTEKAGKRVSNVRNEALNDICLVNYSLKRSEVFPSDAKLKLAGVKKIENFSKGNEPEPYRLKLINYYGDEDELEQEIRSTQQKYDADIMVIYIKKKYKYQGANGNKKVFGFHVRTGPNNSTPIQSLAVVAIKSTATRELTFAHEVAHLFGCRHHTESSNQYYERAYKFKAGWPKRDFRTLVYGGEAKKRYCWNYSNPDVTFEDVSNNQTETGAFRNNNAKKIRIEGENVACIIEDPSIPQNFNAFIGGPDFLPNDGQLYSAHVFNACSPVSYEWSYSTNGSHYISLGSGTEVILYPNDFPGYEDKRLELKLTAINCDGQVKIRTRPIFFGNIPVQPPPQIQAGELINVFPNPSLGKLNIKFSIADPGNVHFSFSNQKGVIVGNTDKQYYSSGEFVQNVNIRSTIGIQELFCEMYIDNRKVGTKKVTLLSN